MDKATKPSVSAEERGDPDEMSPASLQSLAAGVAVVVSSFDGCADIWPDFFRLMFRFWPDLPYPLYLISNHLAFPDHRVTTLRVGDDLSWSETLARGLERVTTRHILLLLDDFFLTGPVYTERVLRMHSAMIAKDAAYLRLVPNPPADLPSADIPEIGEITKGAPYRASLQTAFWERNVLIGLLRREESAWDFEIKGSRRSDDLDLPFLSVTKGQAALPYRHVLLRGKLLPDAVSYFAPLGVTFDLSRRKVESRLYLWWQNTFVRRYLGRVWRRFFHP